MLITYGFFLISLLLLTILFRSKKKWRNTFLGIIAVCYGGPILVIVALSLRAFFTGSTDLAEIQIEGYRIGQRIEDFSMLEKAIHVVEDTTVLYHVVDKNYIYIAAGAEDAVIQYMEIWPDSNQERYAWGNLVFGQSSLSEVEQIFGEKYSKMIWSEMFEKEIKYYDKKNRMILTLGFLEDRLCALILEKR